MYLPANDDAIDVLWEPMSASYGLQVMKSLTHENRNAYVRCHELASAPCGGIVVTVHSLRLAEDFKALGQTKYVSMSSRVDIRFVTLIKF